MEGEPIGEVVPALDSAEELAVEPEAEGYRYVLLRFFRDLTEGERLQVLVALDAIENESNERMTQAVERHLLDWLVREGRIAEIKEKIDDFISAKTGRKS